MLTYFRHYTDSELLRFVRNTPDHLAAEGELVRRIVSEEWESQVRDEEKEELDQQLEDVQKSEEALKEQLEDVQKSEEALKEQLDETKQELADLKSKISELIE